MARLPKSFFTSTNTLQIARDLLGKTLVTNFKEKLTSGLIVETEAYLGKGDKACHASGGLRTKRTETMYMEGGVSYVYLCYGIHHMFNIVTHQQNYPHAILIRAIEPVLGIETMLDRRKKSKKLPSLTAGPGSLAKALGIKTHHSGFSLQDGPIWVEDHDQKISKERIIASPRVGVAYAKEDALLPYRFRIKDNPWTSPAF